ncbi:transglutaminase family protein [Celeribacter indicus]|uniref:Transglutaminase n=1 Tax=Celeribacter indicus TaxID=1208324 RepID=A0A0B5DT35_9RHOB|nr:transglutaminase family protein [Celeribacter indicus]AJE46199.1 transglutaminase [Celeribacter indicus]SDW49796.1 Transglutaminase-like enzyme, putative cysteine protease [Celeribacter indicus]
MRLSIRHTTRYSFDHPVIYGLQQLRKTPKSGHGQEVIRWSTSVTGGRKELEYQDHMHNVVELISFERDVHDLVVQCEGEVEVAETHGVVGAHRGPAPLWMFERPTPLTRAGAGVRALVRRAEGETALARLHELSRIVAEAVAYEIGATHAGGSAEQAVEQGKGVCQDHAHIFIAAAREMGLPARYVSGYLMMDDRVAQDASHAWAEAHVDGLGWVGFDVSNGISPDTRYVRVATGLDYKGAAPVTGTQIGGAGETLSVEIEVAQQQ